MAGTPVYDRTGERLGTIEDLMLDKHSGRVAYAVMRFGGFLGIGERVHPLPWSVLRYDVPLGGYVVDLDRDRLQGAPAYGPGDAPDWTSRDWGRRRGRLLGRPLDLGRARQQLRQGWGGKGSLPSPTLPFVGRIRCAASTDSQK